MTVRLLQRSARPELFALCTFALVGSLEAQTGAVLPAGSRALVTRDFESMLTPRQADLPVRIQHVFDAAQFPRSSGMLTSIAFRRNAHYATPVPAGSLTLTVRIVERTRPFSWVTVLFADQVSSATPKVFYQGTVQYPAAPPGPVPGTFTHVLKPNAPLAFAPGGAGVQSICLESRITASSFVSDAPRLDAISTMQRGRRDNGRPQSSCKFSNQNPVLAIMQPTQGLTPAGGLWYASYLGAPTGTLGVVAVSFHGLDRPGPWPLPIDLGAFGAPSCAWHVGLETGIWLPVAANGQGWARTQDLTIPKSLGGWSFFEQGLFFDRKANAAGLVATWSSEWYVEHGLTVTGATVWRPRDSGNATVASGFAGNRVVVAEFRN